MPLVNGFQFAEEFEKLDQAIQDKYYIVALTSSIEISDINKINSYRSLRTQITKPMTADSIALLLNKIVAEFGIGLA
jgi:hypothetical protein